MLEQLKELRAKAERELQTISDLQALERWRINYLGKKGELTLALRSVGKLPAEERPAAGLLANETKEALEQAFAAHAEKLRQAVSVPVVLFDERFTTRIAEQVLLEADLPRRKRKQVRDRLSAVILLQSYLDSQREAVSSG